MSSDDKILDDPKVKVFIDLGLPGCYGMGMVPGSIPGTLRRADHHHKILAALVLKLHADLEAAKLQLSFRPGTN